MGGNSGADTDRQTAVTNLAKQVRKEYGQFVYKRAVDPFRTPGVRSDLPTDPFPGLRLRADIRSQRHVMLRFVMKCGVFEGLAKKAQVYRRVAEVRQGRSDRLHAKGARGLPK